jgi:hypothetical protein
MSVLSKSAVPVVDVNTYTRGILGPSNEMLGPVKNGGVIKAGTPVSYTHLRAHETLS